MSHRHRTKQKQKQKQRRRQQTKLGNPYVHLQRNPSHPPNQEISRSKDDCSDRFVRTLTSPQGKVGWALAVGTGGGKEKESAPA